MQTILILGAGKSSTYLIDFLADSCANSERKLIVADLDLALAKSKLKTRINCQAEQLDSSDLSKRRNLIAS